MLLDLSHDEAVDIWSIFVDELLNQMNKLPFSNRHFNKYQKIKNVIYIDNGLDLMHKFLINKKLPNKYH